MGESVEKSLPKQIANALSGIPAALMPASLKALDRLVGSVVDLPVAWLAQQKAKIDSQTQSIALVEAAIAKAVASEAGADGDTIKRAFDNLVRKQYRKQVNREAVASAMIENLNSSSSQGPPETPRDVPPIDEDWLNVFERYAEDASSDRMQKLWGRVLAGEVRSPGRFSLRTLRFLSEFSQNDALAFAEFCKSAFGSMAPAKLVKPAGEEADIRDLIFMEAAGLLQGASGLGLTYSMKFDEFGRSTITEGRLTVLFYSEPGSRIKQSVVALTPMGQELILLLPDRDARVAARRVALSIRSPGLKRAELGTINDDGRFYPFEVLWEDAAPMPPAAG